MRIYASTADARAALSGEAVVAHSVSNLLADDHRVWRAAGNAATLTLTWPASEWASGIASATRALVVAAAPVPVVCTRKQTPFTKALSVKAVRAGGAAIHRLGLSETLLLFAEHRQFIQESPEQIVQRLKIRAPEQRRVVEVHDLADAKCWAQAGAEVLQMDKFTPAQVAECAVEDGRNQIGRASCRERVSSPV